MKKTNLRPKSKSSEHNFLPWAGFCLVLVGTIVGIFTYVSNHNRNSAERTEAAIKHQVEVKNLLSEIQELFGSKGSFPSVPFSLSWNSKSPSTMELNQANAKIEKILLIDPKNEEARFYEAYYFHKIGRTDAAINIMRKLISESKREDPVQYTNLGTFLLRNKEHKEAIIALKKAISIDPKYGPAYNSLGHAYIFDNKESEAIEVFQKLLEIDKRYIAAYNGLGVAYWNLKKLDAAKTAFETAINHDPNYFEAVMNIGKLYLQKKDYHKALATFERSTLIDNKSNEAWFNFATAQYILGKYNEAATSYKKAIDIDSSNNMYHLGLAYSLLRTEDYEKCIPEFMLGLTLNRSDAESVIEGLTNLANSLEKDKKPTAARQARHVLLVLKKEMSK